jgi:hypothetical protein
MRKIRKSAHAAAAAAAAVQAAAAASSSPITIDSHAAATAAAADVSSNYRSIYKEDEDTMDMRDDRDRRRVKKAEARCDGIPEASAHAPVILPLVVPSSPPQQRLVGIEPNPGPSSSHSAKRRSSDEESIVTRDFSAINKRNDERQAMFRQWAVEARAAAAAAATAAAATAAATAVQASSSSPITIDSHAAAAAVTVSGSCSSTYKEDEYTMDMRFIDAFQAFLKQDDTRPTLDPHVLIYDCSGHRASSFRFFCELIEQCHCTIRIIVAEEEEEGDHSIEATEMAVDRNSTAYGNRVIANIIRLHEARVQVENGRKKKVVVDTTAHAHTEAAAISAAAANPPQPRLVGIETNPGPRSTSSSSSVASSSSQSISATAASIAAITSASDVTALTTMPSYHIYQEEENTMDMRFKEAEARCDGILEASSCSSDNIAATTTLSIAATSSTSVAALTTSRKRKGNLIDTDSKPLRIGNRMVSSENRAPMHDSTSDYLKNNYVALRKRLEKDGFIFIRNVIPIEDIDAARQMMIAQLGETGALREGRGEDEPLIQYRSEWNKVKNERFKVSSSSSKLIEGLVVDAETGGSESFNNTKLKDSTTKEWSNIGKSAVMKNVYYGDSLKLLYQRLFENDASYTTRQSQRKNALPYTALTDCTWLRAKGSGETTPEHVDYFYFANNTKIFSTSYIEKKMNSMMIGSDDEEDEEEDSSESEAEEGSHTCKLCHDSKHAATTVICDICDHGYHLSCLKPQLFEVPKEDCWNCYECRNQSFNYWTCWIPLGDLTANDGRLALIPESHNTYGGYTAPRKLEEELIPSEYTKQEERTAKWVIPTNIGRGDIILFNIKTIHAASQHTGDKFRLSIDTRITTCTGYIKQPNNKKAALSGCTINYNDEISIPIYPSPTSVRQHYVDPLSSATVAKSLDFNCAMLNTNASKSNVDNADKGLFSTKQFTRANERLGWYWGKQVSECAWQMMINKGVDPTHREGEEDYITPIKAGSWRCKSLESGLVLLGSEQCPFTFLNHSKSANVKMVETKPTTHAYQFIEVIALRNIAKGEELLLNYGWEPPIWTIVKSRMQNHKS